MSMCGRRRDLMTRSNSTRQWFWARKRFKCGGRRRGRMLAPCLLRPLLAPPLACSAPCLLRLLQASNGPCRAAAGRWAGGAMQTQAAKVHPRAKWVIVSSLSCPVTKWKRLNHSLFATAPCHIRLFVGVDSFSLNLRRTEPPKLIDIIKTNKHAGVNAKSERSISLFISLSIRRNARSYDLIAVG